MKRITSITVAAAVALGMAGLAWGASVHFKPRSPTALDAGMTLTVAGTLAGLGNGDVTITLTALADTSTTCTNQGGNQAPGQNPGDITTAGATMIPSTQVKNGSLTFTVSTNPPPQPTAMEAGCPNGNWSAAYTDLAFTSAVIQVQQGGAIVLTKTITFSPPTDNGAVPANEMTVK